VTGPIRVRGATLAEAFAEAALAALARTIPLGPVEERDVREVRAHGRTVADLLANWIDECLYVHEVESFAWRRVEFAVFEVDPGPGAEPMRLHSFLHGEEISLDSDRPAASSTSAASIAINPVDGGWEIALFGSPDA
jgi:SHS2 domain-containing protein